MRALLWLLLPALCTAEAAFEYMYEARDIFNVHERTCEGRDLNSLISDTAALSTSLLNSLYDLRDGTFDGKPFDDAFDDAIPEEDRAAAWRRGGTRFKNAHTWLATELPKACGSLS